MIKLETKQQRQAWFNAAREILIKHLKNNVVVYEDEIISTMNDVYESVIKVKANTGKSLGRPGKTTPTMAHIESVRALLPGIDEKIEAMNTRPAALELEFAKKEIEILKKRVVELEEMNHKLVAALPSSRPSFLDPDKLAEQQFELEEMMKALQKDLSYLKRLHREKQINGD